MIREKKTPAVIGDRTRRVLSCHYVVLDGSYLTLLVGQKRVKSCPSIPAPDQGGTVELECGDVAPFRLAGLVPPNVRLTWNPFTDRRANASSEIPASLRSPVSAKKTSGSHTNMTNMCSV